MTNDPFQLFIIILMMAGAPFLVWGPSRISKLIEAGEEKRVPELLKHWVNKEYIEAVRRGEREPEKDYRWKIFLVLIGLFFPSVMLCSATAENLMPRLMVILASAIVFFIGVALLEWFVRPI